MREDIAIAAWAKEMGFEVDKRCNRFRNRLSPYEIGESIPHHSLLFTLRDVSAWQVRGGWKYARLIDGLFLQHSEVFSSVETCLHDVLAVQGELNEEPA